MTTYYSLDWNSQDHVKGHLYRRLADPMNTTLGFIRLAQESKPGEINPHWLKKAELSLESAIMFLKAWSTLVHYKTGNPLRAYQKRTFAASEPATWLKSYLDERIVLDMSHTCDISAHRETLHEALNLMVSAAGALGVVLRVETFRRPNDVKAVWYRVVYTPQNAESASDMATLLADLDQDGPEADTALQLHLAFDLVALNSGLLTLQLLPEGKRGLAFRLETVVETTPTLETESEAADAPEKTKVAQPIKQA